MSIDNIDTYKLICFAYNTLYIFTGFHGYGLSSGSRLFTLWILYIAALCPVWIFHRSCAFFSRCNFYP